MARNLQGLNVVHPVVHDADNNDLLAGQSYPDLRAQLDLWTNLTFEDEGQLGNKTDDGYGRQGRAEEEEEEAILQSPTTESATHDGHVNVVTAREHHFDLNALIAGFGIDPFSVPPQPHLAPSLAQLLALHNSTVPVVYPLMPPSPREELATPPAKRSRTRKTSVSLPASAAAVPEPGADGPVQTISAAEDKRRRNTAASARFRLKKKEREAALEAKAKELEQRVNELERECEGLRRENGWLKGLVVGVTGAAQAPAGATKRTREED